MLDTTYIQAAGLKASINYLSGIKAEMTAPTTQNVIYLKRRTLPPAPPAALTEALEEVETFLLAQAVVAIDDQIAALQLSFDNL
jgi:hypothetical protein